MLATFAHAFSLRAVANRSARRGGRRHNAAAQDTVKAYAQMSTAEKRLFNLEKARAARRNAQPQPQQETKMSETKKAAYVRTNVKLSNLGHGRRETEIDGVKVGINWNGAAARFDYTIGSAHKAGGATRDVAVALLNAALAERGLPPVRA